MEITKIQQQKKKKNRYSIFVDDKYSFSISGNDLLKTRLQRGLISKTALLKVIEAATVGILYEYSIAHEGRRPHSLFEHKTYLYKKINQLDIKPENKNNYINSTLQKLIDSGYQSDQTFTKWFIKQRINSSKPKGTMVIMKELQQKGITTNIIKEELSKTLDKSREKQNAQVLANKKKRLLQANHKELTDTEIKAKLTKYLMSRGYTYNVIKCIQLI